MGVTIQPFGFDKAREKAKRGNPQNDTVILRRLQYIAEEMIKHYRIVTPSHDTGGYNDQTGNLRHSNGCRIYKDGQLVYETMDLSGFSSKDPDVPTVTENDIKVALDDYALGCDLGNGWTILLVVGMDYGKYVEAKGYNVMHLTGIELQRKVDELKKELGL